MEATNATTPKTAISRRISELAESATLQMAALARALKAEGKDIINLSLGEPDFDTPKHICDAAKQAIDDGYTRYTPVSGFVDLREAICTKFKRDNKLDYTPQQIVVSTGAKQSIANVVFALVNPGDEVIMPIPYWVSYAAQVELAEGVLVEVNTSINNDFKMTAADLEAAITPKTKLIIFSSPCNPTGGVYSKSELKAIAEVVASHDNLYVIADEIYEHINYGGKHESLAQFDIVKDRVVTVNGLSKGFAMTGWRLGYIGAPLSIAKACAKMQGQFTSGTCAITQRAAIAALLGSLNETYAMREAFQRRRDLLLSLLNDIPGVKTYVPQGAFYIFPDISYYFNKSDGETTINNASELCMYILNNAHVSVVTGSAFGNPNCMRLSYATNEATLREAAKRIKNCLAKLK